MPDQHQGSESLTDPIAKPIPVEKQRAMGDVFDRWRINQGWNPWDDTTQDMAIASWVHSLDRENVPAAAYSELYELVLKTRALAIQNGKTIPGFGVELLLAHWTGEHGLRAELRRREVEQGRTLANNAESQCKDCFGSGWKTIMKGDYPGTVKCDHGNS